MTTELTLTDHKEVQAVFARLNGRGKPKPDDLDRARSLLQRYPELLRDAGDLAHLAREGLVDYASGKNPLAVELISRDLDRKRAELGYAQAGGLERLLIDSVLLAWLRYTDCERRYTLLASDTQVTLVQGEYRCDRLNAAQRRYLRAVEALARVRKLGITLLQVNIGGQQVNVSGAIVPRVDDKKTAEVLT